MIMRAMRLCVKGVKGKGVKGTAVKGTAWLDGCLDFPKTAATTTSVSHPARGRRPTMQSVAHIFATSRLVSLAA